MGLSDLTRLGELPEELRDFWPGLPASPTPGRFRNTPAIWKPRAYEMSKWKRMTRR